MNKITLRVGRTGKITALLQIALILISLAAIPLTKRADLSGGWIMNTEKSDFGGLAPSTMIKRIQVRQQSEDISIQRFVDPNGPQDTVSLEVLRFDGSTTETKVSGARKVSSMKWADDGRGFTEISETTDGHYDRINTQIWTLSVDGQTLTTESNIVLKATGNVFKTKMVYTKTNK